MWDFKNELMIDNDAYLELSRKIYELYRRQPLRKTCKICGTPTSVRFQFHSHGIKYHCCENCGHINGEYEDTPSFCKSLYEIGDTVLSKVYCDSDYDIYMKRVATIYLPKAHFFRDSIDSLGVKIDGLSHLDMGAGSGHFVAALRQIGVDAYGVEVDEKQVLYVNKMMRRGIVKHCSSEDIHYYIEQTKSNSISFIYVLEHLQNVMQILEVIQRNPNIKYIYLSVPLFSFTNILESITPDVYARILDGVHTHIYTRESINWICQKFNWKIVSAWYFGADIADLIRTAIVKLRKQGDERYAEFVNDKLRSCMDELQSVIDKNFFCSGIHCLIKK